MVLLLGSFPKVTLEFFFSDILLGIPEEYYSENRSAEFRRNFAVFN